MLTPRHEEKLRAQQIIHADLAPVLLFIELSAVRLLAELGVVLGQRRIVRELDFGDVVIVCVGWAFLFKKLFHKLVLEKDGNVVHHWHVFRPLLVHLFFNKLIILAKVCVKFGPLHKKWFLVTGVAGWKSHNKLNRRQGHHIYFILHNFVDDSILDFILFKFGDDAEVYYEFYVELGQLLFCY